MAVPDQVLQLTERFDRNLDAYRSPEYKETQLRVEFIDPFFKALGWDVDNEQGYAEAYKDVIHEDAIKVGGATKAPDYCFRIGGTRKFFLEAKKPSVDLKHDVHPAFQLRRYAWSAKLPLSILTDFEEFAVYDCRVRPLKTDNAGKARIIYMTYSDYADRWADIAAIFDRQEVLKGSFDKYAESTKAKKGTAEVDTAFLKEIESWRDVLARNFALRNPKLTQRELNFAVQRTIDRVIFLRMCEDRGIETYGQLLALRNGPAAYPRLGELFRRADERYNSSLFYFTPEKGREPPDELTLGLKLDDKPLKDILGHLYYPDCPYEFSVLPADILGQVYEQFLGKVIRLTKGHRAVVEDKPEVKKAGGVYYTPTYIVDYIVKHTVGKMLEQQGSGFGVRGSGEEGGKHGDQDASAPADAVPGAVRGQAPKRSHRRASRKRSGRDRGSPIPGPLRILDPACGSGSFLIAAYQYLLDWHLTYYTTHDPEKWARQKTPCIYQTLNPEPRTLTPGWRLTTAERKRILLTHIFGVDIDPQAVEVTKLSLLLKVLEGESQQTLDSQLRLFHERALPDLNNNIKCGNSLIGPDFYDNQQMTFLDEEERYRINVFDWHAEFPEVFGGQGSGAGVRGSGRKARRSSPDPRSGFDVVIGNPPYVRIQGMKEWAPIEVEHYKKAYRAASKGNYDIYVVFVERGLQLLNTTGRLGFILPHKFFNAKYGSPLRALLSESNHLAHVVHFGHQQVFAGATTYTCLMFLDKDATDRCDFTKVTNLQAWRASPSDSITGVIPAESITASEWNFAVGEGSPMLHRLLAMPIKLSHATNRIFQGIKTGGDKVYIVQELETRASVTKVWSRQTESEWWLESALLHPLIKGGDSARFSLTSTERKVLFPYYQPHGQSVQLIPEPTMRLDYPLTWKYLVKNRAFLEQREHGKMKGEDWWGYTRNQALEVMPFPKVFTPDISPRAAYSLDEAGSVFFTGGVAGGYGILAGPNWSPEYLLGLLNSRLMDWLHHQRTTAMRGGWYSYESRFIRDLPMRAIDRSNEGDVCLHNNVVGLVQRMLELHKQLAEAKTAHDKESLQRQIDATDRQIDELVYELYGLTDDEIRIVEEAAR